TVQEIVRENTKKHIPKDEISKAVLGDSNEEKRVTRESIIRGLLLIERTERVKKMIGATKTVKKVLDMAIYAL
ncbi:42405_t:CDS:1, partial [Gigaspora margarita]